MSDVGTTALRRVVAIADDLTGAAEIAGIGQRFGFMTRIVRREAIASSLAAAASQPPRSLLVIDTDTRLVPPADAARACAAIAGRLPRDIDLVFKKTDSVLRGNVAAETSAIAAALGRDRLMLLPQNPSRGRTIVGGRYWVSGVPLHQTAFARDPDHPAATDDAAELLARTACLEGVTIAVVDAADERDVEAAARAAVNSRHGLPAGGADFFEALLVVSGETTSAAAGLTMPGRPRVLMVCGSNSDYTPTLLERARRCGIERVPAPAGALERGERSLVEAWAAAAIDVVNGGWPVLLAIDRPTDPTPGASPRLLDALARAAVRAIERVRPGLLSLEGGATAAAVCQRLDHHDCFRVEHELATGVIAMRAAAASDGPLLLVKPGSYAWPESVWALVGGE